MAELPGYREQIHAEKFDTLVRGVGASGIAQRTKLFRALNTGQPELTNMQEGGRLSNEELFLVLSLRFYVQFATDAMYRLIEDGAMFTFFVGNKAMLGPVPLFVAPCGGGMYGFDIGAAPAIINNGFPGWDGALTLAKPVKIEKNQHFSVDVEFYNFASLDAGVTPAINPLGLINADLGLKVIKCFLGGILERNVQ